MTHSKEPWKLSEKIEGYIDKWIRKEGMETLIVGNSTLTSWMMKALEVRES